MNGLFSQPLGQPRFTNIFARGDNYFAPPLRGTVEVEIDRDRPGRVKCLGTYWPARFAKNESATVARPSEPVAVVARQGMTMLVTAVDEA